MRNFLIDDSQMDREPTEQELRDIRKLQRSASWMWRILVVTCVGTVVSIGYLAARASMGGMSWSRLFVVVIGLLTLVAAGICLVLYYTALWLWANRDVGKSVIYPSTMSPVLTDLFDDASQLPKLSGVATGLFSVAIICIMAAILF